MTTIFEVYFGDCEMDELVYSNSYWETESEALAFAERQVLCGQYTVVRFETNGSLADAMNGNLKQRNRTIIVEKIK